MRARPLRGCAPDSDVADTALTWLDAQLQPQRHYYLGDQAAIEAAVKAVAAQGKAAG